MKHEVSIEAPAVIRLKIKTMPRAARGLAQASVLATLREAQGPLPSSVPRFTQWSLRVGMQDAFLLDLKIGDPGLGFRAPTWLALVFVLIGGVLPTLGLCYVWFWRLGANVKLLRWQVEDASFVGCLLLAVSFLAYFFVYRDFWFLFKMLAAASVPMVLLTHRAFVAMSHLPLALDDPRGRTGPAWLFERAANVSEGPCEDRVMTTGKHTISDIYCNDCGTNLGWRYHFAMQESQKYKEGKFILERELLMVELQEGGGAGRICTLGDSDGETD
ncbi:hypothetical protein Emed_001045 [Eimeria media]